MRRTLSAVAALLCRGGWRMAPLVALFIAGCGGELYEQRLERTKVLFAHTNLLNAHLLGSWTDPETGVGLRVPLQFALLPPPARPDPNAPKEKSADEGEKAAAEAPEEPAEIHDDRQPRYLNVELPGLRGAFTASVKVVGENGSDSTGEAFLYVMSNAELAEKADEAKEFNRNFITLLCEALNIAPPENDTYETARFPARVVKDEGPFVEQLTYTHVSITPNAEISGLNRQFDVYLHERGGVQAVVLLVLPKDWDSSEKLGERIPLCLETLQVPERLSLPNVGATSASPTGGTGF